MGEFCTLSQRLNGYTGSVSVVEVRLWVIMFKLTRMKSSTCMEGGRLVFCFLVLNRLDRPDLIRISMAINKGERNRLIT